MKYQQQNILINKLQFWFITKTKFNDGNINRLNIQRKKIKIMPSTFENEKLKCIFSFLGRLEII